MTGKFTVFLLILFIIGCQKAPDEQKVLLRVNDYELTKAEFEEEFKGSIYSVNDTPQARKDFLNNCINQKLILQDAQASGLDKQKSFLKAIEKFWEQTLLKIALDKRSKDISGSVSVSDDIVKEAYDKMVEDGRTDKPYEQMREQIKWELIRLKETQMVNDWMEGLRKKAQIKINYELLQNGKEVRNE